MTDTISTMELRKRLGDILDRVALRHDHFIIERKGRPLAAVIPAERLQRLEDALHGHLLETMERPSKLKEKTADRLGRDAKRWARQRGRRKKAKS